ncbi:hypothetical protein [Zavarzinia compransoris]|uniref:ArsR family transcriptional regulator n=1 Tax=Zavarzinia compransoris TaxID=1264899 RepID=A0A317E8E3_9PROT|nr:hypothetical protein [Zavarzinia compransoris]PWR23367.1 hypothetical protein DKG75_02015 [Zavarzinia compransoris]TDP46059.1 hypothetical protein DES42_104140 [Zavarzinia compransoris]
MQEIAQAWTAHLRVTLLRVLEGLPERAANESILADAVAAYAIMATRDQIRGQIVWLAEQGLLRTEEIGGLTLATLTQRGVDVASGRASHPGVKRPSPKG